MSKTIAPDAHINQHVTGYVVNASFDVDTQQAIAKIQDEIAHELGSAVWIPPLRSLHVTLLDWIAPLVEYNRNKDQLYAELYHSYDAVLHKILDKQHSINTVFKEIRVSQSAIYIVSTSNAELNHIRQQFLKNITLIDDTKQPPQIVHSTIARFTETIELDKVQEVLETLHVDIAQEITSFQLVKETVSPMIDYEMIKKYRLMSKPSHQH